MFDDFWKLYPRKIAKKHAMQMWKRLSKEQQDKALATIQNHIQQWAKELRDDSKIPHAGTWLNGWRFDDDLTPVKPAYVAPKPVERPINGMVWDTEKKGWVKADA